MMGNQKLLVMWVCMLLVVSLFPLAHCKRGRGGRGGLGKPAKAPSQNKGLKLAGAAVAGALGGAAIGYGLGSLGRPSYEDGSRRNYPNGPGNHSHSYWENKRNTGSSEQASILIALGTVTHIFMWG